MLVFNGETYKHISDKKKCFENGKFDYIKSKSMTFNMEEIEEMKDVIKKVVHYKIFGEKVCQY